MYIKDWEKVVTGWWCKENHGCVMKESDGWYFYRIYTDLSFGPYKTMGIAIKASEVLIHGK